MFEIVFINEDGTKERDVTAVHYGVNMQESSTEDPVIQFEQPPASAKAFAVTGDLLQASLADYYIASVTLTKFGDPVLPEGYPHGENAKTVGG